MDMDKPEITYDDFLKLDLRVATIKACEEIPDASKLYKLTLDLGSLGERVICAGLKGHYTKEALVGKQIVIVANLAPRKMRGVMSQGMLLAATDSASGVVLCVTPDVWDEKAEAERDACHLQYQQQPKMAPGSNVQ